MTVPHYAFLDAGMDVDVASPSGGVIPVDPKSLKPVIRTSDDDRFLADDELRSKVADSLAIGDLDMSDYDVVFLAGGWGAAFDFGFSEPLGEKMTEANAAGLVIGRRVSRPARAAQREDCRWLAARRRPQDLGGHRQAGAGTRHRRRHRTTPNASCAARAHSSRARRSSRDPFANHWVVDGNLVTGQNQNAGPMVAREMMQIVAAAADAGASPS